MSFMLIILHFQFYFFYIFRFFFLLRNIMRFSEIFKQEQSQEDDAIADRNLCIMLKMDLLHLPTGEIIIVGSCYSWGYYIEFSAISILLFLSLAKLPELAKTELLLISQLIGWVLPVSMPNMTLQCFSSPCLFYWDLTQTIVPITNLK